MRSDFDWPSAQRKDTMYLSTLPTSKGPNVQSHLMDRSLITRDIEGAFCSNRFLKYLNKPNFTNSTAQFVKSPQGKQKGYHKKDLQLQVDDIQGSRPNNQLFKTNRKPSNPLNPVYELSKVNYIEPVPLRFIRDTLKIDDIQGCRPVLKTKQRNIQLQTYSPQSKPPLHFKERDSLKVQDINKTQKQKFMQKLDASLRAQRSEIEKSKPKRLHPLDSSKPNFNFDLRDIPGAKVSQSFYLKKINKIKQSKSQANAFDQSIFANSDFIAISPQRRYEQSYVAKPKVEGAQANSLNRGIKTKRCTNPLMPRYQYPGRESSVQNFQKYFG